MLKLKFRNFSQLRNTALPYVSDFNANSLSFSSCKFNLEYSVDRGRIELEFENVGKSVYLENTLSKQSEEKTIRWKGRSTCFYFWQRQTFFPPAATVW